LDPVDVRHTNASKEKNMNTRRSMDRSTRIYGRRAAVAAAIAALWLLSPACKDDPPAASDETEGGENALERAGSDADRAHQDFKREVKPAAEWVDEKTKEAVGEGKKAVRKTADAIDQAVNGDEESVGDAE
jgi:hypothetical protein